jgi:hypothetical protein
MQERSLPVPALDLVSDVEQIGTGPRCSPQEILQRLDKRKLPSSTLSRRRGEPHRYAATIVAIPSVFQVMVKSPALGLWSAPQSRKNSTGESDAAASAL